MSLHWLPVALAVSLGLSAIVPYAISVFLGHVDPLLPYISDAGVLLPERAFFSFFVNLSAFVHFCLVYVRFEQVCAKAKNYRTRRCLVAANKSGFWLGALVSFGLGLIANFQLEVDTAVHTVQPASSSIKSNSSDPEVHSLLLSTHTLQMDTTVSKNVQNIHWAGAFFAFVGGIAWMLLQAVVTPQIASSSSDRGLFLTRSAFSVLALLFFLLGVPLSLVADDMAKADLAAGMEEEGETAAALGIMAASCEWAVAVLIIAYMLTFTGEFASLGVTRVKVVARRVRVAATAAAAEDCEQQQQQGQLQQLNSCDEDVSEDSSPPGQLQQQRSTSTVATSVTLTTLVSCGEDSAEEDRLVSSPS